MRDALTAIFCVVKEHSTDFVHQDWFTHLGQFTQPVKIKLCESLMKEAA